MKTMNANIKQTFIDPTDELNSKLNAFDGIIAATFGNEVTYIKHELFSENVSFTSVKFTNDDYIGFRISSKMIIDDTYNASMKHLRKAFKAFNIETPVWMYC